jgi:hypothetical protein
VIPRVSARQTPRSNHSSGLIPGSSMSLLLPGGVQRTAYSVTNMFVICNVFPPAISTWARTIEKAHTGPPATSILRERLTARDKRRSPSLVWQLEKREDTTIVVACICLYRMSRILVLTCWWISLTDFHCVTFDFPPSSSAVISHPSHCCVRPEGAGDIPDA